MGIKEYVEHIFIKFVPLKRDSTMKLINYFAPESQINHNNWNTKLSNVWLICMIITFLSYDWSDSLELSSDFVATPD